MSLYQSAGFTSISFMAKLAFNFPAKVDSLFEHKIDHLSALISFQILKSSEAAIGGLEWFVCTEQVAGHFQMTAFDRLIKTSFGLKVKLSFCLALKKLSHICEPLIA